MRVLWKPSLPLSLYTRKDLHLLTLCRGSKQVRNGNYNQKEFFIVLPALLFSAQAAGQLFSLAPEVTRAKAAAQSVFSLHDEKPTIITKLQSSMASSNSSSAEQDALLASSSSAAYGTFGVRGELEFRGVSFYYDSRPEVPALNNVSFLIRPGEYVAFVGRSGAGKSSTVHLIERFFDPTSGQVFLDARDIRTESVQTHRARLALVVSDVPHVVSLHQYEVLRASSSRRVPLLTTNTGTRARPVPRYSQVQYRPWSTPWHQSE
jgi:ATP-binding cassette subfamily B (MDR/TAP) protein 1